MSFDENSSDRYQRFLVYHPESDCLFEAESLAEYEQYCQECDDVTGVTWAEDRFKKQGK